MSEAGAVPAGDPVAVMGAGAFGTALAVALAARGPVTLWARRGAEAMATARENAARLPGVPFPPGLTVTGDADALTPDVVLLAVPMAGLAGLLQGHGARLDGRMLVVCCKGIDPLRLCGPAAIVSAACPAAAVAVLTGPSFAADIARGLPTALTLACADPRAGAFLQGLLAAPALRPYRSTDVVGAELGGALKNVVALAAGIVTGAGLGESARAATITRGHAEMTRLALRLGARAGTLAGLSGFGDLVLTATSPRSRNFAHGVALGAGRPPAPGITVEGIPTAAAVRDLSARLGLEMPLACAVADVCAGRQPVAEAIASVFNRPLKEE
ncbi:MAG: NAD(P)H-dependent glycerol-3-phosphate dehydrogenase [Alkalilacustris sp.]